MPDKDPTQQHPEIVEEPLNEDPEYSIETTRTVSEEFLGPIPPPGVLAEYNQVLPGAANRIIAMAEKEAAHRHEMDKSLLQAQINGMKYEASDTKRGQVFGFLIGLAALFVGGACAYMRQEIAASFIGAGGIVGLVTAFIIGRRGTQNSKPETTLPEAQNSNENPPNL